MEHNSNSFLNRGLSASWISLPAAGTGVAGTGAAVEELSSSELEKKLSERVRARLSSGDFGPEKIEYITDVDFNVTKGSLKLGKRKLELLRSLCQLWDIDFLPAKISSHRPFIGPLIVSVKKAIYPIIKVLLKDLIHQQRSFNAAVVALAVEVANEQEQEDAHSSDLRKLP